ncbi:MAG: DUF192 domain-containing protein [Chlorobi bacterium]|nr:DUF192 domain-containing protein [Chlorobiota bacterium]
MNTKQKAKLRNRKNPKHAFWTRRNIVIIALVVIAVIASYFLFIKKPGAGKPEWIKEGEVTFLSKDSHRQLAKIDVEAAITPAERSLGLMFRSEMDEDKGMLFIFEQSDMQSFWMKNTKIPLDILFIDSRGVINTIHRNTVPYSEKPLPSKQKSQFVVEVNAGFCSRRGINEGDLIEYKLTND